MPAGIPLLLFVACGLGAQQAELLDRIAVSIGTDAITETEVLDEIRVTALLNGDPPDLSPKARREAAERLVDQQLIRADIKAVQYPEPENSEADRMLAEFRQQRFPGDREFRAALDRYGVTEEQLKAHLLWQLTALRFTDYRFRSGVPPPGEGLRRHLEEESKDRAKIDAAQPPPARNGHANSQSNGRAPETREQKPETRPGEPEPGERALPHSVDQQMERWLEQARLRTRIRFHEEAFR